MVFFTRIVVLFVFQSENMEALNVLRILTAPHILSANMKNANVGLVSSEMEERASLVRRLIPINNLRNSKKNMCLSWGISFHWPRNRDIQDEMVYATTIQIRVSQPLAKLSVPLKLNPVGLGWKQYTGDQPGIRAVLMSLLFFLSCFLVFLFLLSYLIEKRRIGKHF